MKCDSASARICDTVNSMLSIGSWRVTTSPGDMKTGKPRTRRSRECVFRRRLSSTRIGSKFSKRAATSIARRTAVSWYGDCIVATSSERATKWHAKLYGYLAALLGV